jgi:glycosyltransferase involved in cell wall biosynthesis
VRDARSLADAMRRMIELPAERRAAMGRAARDRIEREFDERIVAARYLEALERALGS